MEVQVNDVELEEGEIPDSSDYDNGRYNLLTRPAENKQVKLIEEDDSSDISEFSSGDDSDEFPMTETRKRIRRNLRRVPKLRLKSDALGANVQLPGIKRNNLWANVAQEDALLENMSGIDVTERKNDRKSEQYDFLAKPQLQEKKWLKRRLSESSDSEHWNSKRIRQKGRDRLPAKLRLGTKSEKLNASVTKIERCPLLIPDIEDTECRDITDIAREITKNLKEKNMELIERALQVLGVDIPMHIYKRTQEIEAEGGILVMSGNRRRSSGGVFLNLLKHEADITAEQRSLIFKTRKVSCDLNTQRDQEVAELREQLSSSNTITEPSAIAARREHLLATFDLNTENQTTSLSNPPPSPENSTEYKTIAMNENDVNRMESTSVLINTNVPGFQRCTLLSYEEDCIDLNYGEMDFV